MIFREMEPRDIRRCLEVRTSVRENRYSLEALEQEGITEAFVAEMLAATHKGWVCEMDGNIIGFSIWGDYDFSKWVGVEISTHLGEFITPGDITENSYLVGPRVIYRRHKLTAYGKVLVGRATITNQNFNLSSSYNVLAYGGGIEYKIMRKINIRAIDFELQNWPDFQPNSLSPMAISIGASYIIH